VRPLLIRYVSHGYQTGYGEAARRIMLALVGQGIRVHWVPIQFEPEHPLIPGHLTSSMTDLEPLRRTAGDPDVVVIHAVPEVIPSLAITFGPGIPLVAHTVWEAVELPPHWPALLNACAGVIVPTSWNAQSFRGGGVSVPVAVVPHVVNTNDTDDAGDIDDEWLGPLGVDVGDSFVVHSVASWSPRKAPWLTVEAYARAFKPQDDTVLVLRTNRNLDQGVPIPPGPPNRRRLTSWSVVQILHRHGPTGRVHLEHNLRSRPELNALQRRSDCWLSLPHAEGWNLGAFDAAAVGTPMVTTGYGGPSEYLTAGTPHLVPGRPMAAPGLDGATWVDPDLDDAIEALRRVRSDPARARRAAQKEGERLRSAYAPTVVAQCFMDALAQMGIG